MPYRFLRFPEGKCKAVTLSYDDGSCYDEKLLKTLNRYEMKCTFNLCSDGLLAGTGLSIEQVKGLLADGHEVAVHGANHLASGIVSPAEGIRDVLRCREALEQTFGRIIRGMAYPDSGITRFSDGNNYERIRSYLKELGIVYSRTLNGDNNRFELPSDWFAWVPTAHHANSKLPEYIDKFLSLDVTSLYCAEQYPRLFYLWGHSHEFECNHNWELLENICQKLGGKANIWYATNIEIYDYVMAYNALIWSANGKLVYNPSLIPLWFTVGDDVYSINAGSTIVIR